VARLRAQPARSARQAQAHTHREPDLHEERHEDDRWDAAEARQQQQQKEEEEAEAAARAMEQAAERYEDMCQDYKAARAAWLADRKPRTKGQLYTRTEDGRVLSEAELAEPPSPTPQQSLPAAAAVPRASAAGALAGGIGHKPVEPSAWDARRSSAKQSAAVGSPGDTVASSAAIAHHYHNHHHNHNHLLPVGSSAIEPPPSTMHASPPFGAHLSHGGLGGMGALSSRMESLAVGDDDAFGGVGVVGVDSTHGLSLSMGLSVTPGVIGPVEEGNGLDGPSMQWGGESQFTHDLPSVLADHGVSSLAHSSLAHSHPHHHESDHHSHSLGGDGSVASLSTA
jgi:hypothetical protein